MNTIAVLAIRVNNHLENRIKVDVDLHGKVSAIREQASKTVMKPTEDLDLVYCGIALEDQNTLASYSFKSGRTIHVLSKTVPKTSNNSETINVNKLYAEAELPKFLFAVQEYGAKNIVQKLPRIEVIKRVLSSVPELSQDIGAVSLLYDPELLLLLSQPKTLQKVLASHPLLCKALPVITAYLRENPINTGRQASTSTGNSYSLEAMSDDEEMDSTQTQPQTREGQLNPLTRNSSYMAITAAQLSAALANARNFTSTGAVVNDTPLSSTSTVPTGSRPIITSEMFGNALQHAFATSSASGTDITGNSSNNTSNQSQLQDESLESLRTRLQPQLQQMRDMGLLDETQNIRALQVTSGDVQAAIEMVFGNDIDMNF